MRVMKEDQAISEMKKLILIFYDILNASNICVDICACAPWVFLWNNHLDLDFVFDVWV